MKLTSELIDVAERTLNAAGLKPKDAAAILTKLSADHAVEFSTDGGILGATQTGTHLQIGTLLKAYAEKNPRDFYGQAGEVRTKSDLAGDQSAKVRYISEHGFDAWQALPFNEQSSTAKYATTDQVPHSGITAAEYARLTVGEKAKLSGEIGHVGIGKILNRR